MATFAIQLRLRRARRVSACSASKLIGARLSKAESTFSNALTLTTAYRRSSIRLVTTGTMPQRAQTRNSAVSVPNAYLETRERSLRATSSAPRGFDVHTPPCFWQKVQSHARAGICVGSGSHVSENEMFPQWHLPRISIGHAVGFDLHQPVPVDQPLSPRRRCSPA